MKKQNLYAVLALALILASALVVGCGKITILEPPAQKPVAGIEEAVVGPLEEGMGAVRLNFNENIGRTILPTTSSFVLANCDHFGLVFTPVPAATPITEYLDYGDRTDAISLPYGNYTLVVTGYRTTNQAEPIAQHNYGAITVDGTPKNITIKLAHFAPTAGTINGTFGWNITNSAAATVASLTLTPISGGESGLAPINIIGTPTSTQAIKEGYYNVILTATKGTYTIKVLNTLHLYRFMTSTFTYTIASAQFPTVNEGNVTGVLWDEIIALGIDNPPSITSLALGGPAYSIDRTAASTTAVVFTVDDPGSVFDANSIRWFLGDPTTPISSTGTFSVNSTTLASLFTEDDIPYTITIRGTIGNVPYDTFIFITITP